MQTFQWRLFDHKDKNTYNHILISHSRTTPICHGIGEDSQWNTGWPKK